METIQQMIEKCKVLISNPDYRQEYLLKAKKNYQGISGYFSNYIPEEIIATAGLYPLRIIGFNDTPKAPRSVMFNPICSFVQDVFVAAHSGSYSFLSNIIFPNSCDSLRVLRQINKFHTFRQPNSFINKWVVGEFIRLKKTVGETML